MVLAQTVYEQVTGIPPIEGCDLMLNISGRPPWGRFCTTYISASRGPIHLQFFVRGSVYPSYKYFTMDDACG